MRGNPDQAKDIQRVLKFINNNKGTKKFVECIKKHEVETIGDIVKLVKKGKIRIMKNGWRYQDWKE